MSGTTSLEGEWNGAHTVSGCGTLPTGVRMQPQHQEWGKGEGRTGLRCRRLPGPPVPRQRRSSLSLAQGRGIRKKSGMRSKESYFFFRSWEQRGQNLKTGKEQGKQKYEVKSVLSRSASGQPDQLLPQPPLTIFPEAWLSAPHRRSGTTRWNTGEEDGTQQSGACAGGERSQLQTPERSPLLQPYFLQGPGQPGQPPSYPALPLSH